MDVLFQLYGSSLFSQLQQFLNLGSYIGDRFCGFEACDNLSSFVGKEFCEVPFYFGAVLVVGVCFRQHLVEYGIYGVAFVPACKSFLFLEELEKGVGIRSVDLNFLEAWKLGAVGKLAEAVDRLVGTWSLAAELVAWEVEYLESLGMVFLV